MNEVENLFSTDERAEVIWSVLVEAYRGRPEADVSHLPTWLIDGACRYAEQHDVPDDGVYTLLAREWVRKREWAEGGVA